jgi:hypothetical protein
MLVPRVNLGTANKTGQKALDDFDLIRPPAVACGGDSHDIYRGTRRIGE